MCSSMKNVASEIHERTNYDCTINSDCGEIQCTVRHNTLKSINLIINSCDHPPSVDVELHMEGDEVPIKIHADRNTTTKLDRLGEDLVIDLWHFNYSMDIEVHRTVTTHTLRYLGSLDRCQVLDKLNYSYTQCFYLFSLQQV